MAKRERGEGSISQRKDGIWTGRIYLGHSADGKQIIKAVYGKTEKDVKKRIKEAKAKLIKNDYVTISNLLFGDLLTKWLRDIKKYELKPSSYDRLEITVNTILKQLGHFKLPVELSRNVQSGNTQNLG